MLHSLRIATIPIICILSFACQHRNTVTITGTLDYLSTEQVFFEKPLLHYKFSEPERIPLNLLGIGRYRIRIPVDTSMVIHLITPTASIPIAVRPGESIRLDADLRNPEFSYKIDGYGEKWAESYQNYLSEEQPLMQEIRRQLPAFRNGEPTNIQELYKLRMQLAASHLGDTPYRYLVHRNTGEYLVRMLEHIRFNEKYTPQRADRMRRRLMSFALENGFFTLESLQVQRAGIRDFTDAWIKTFRVQDRLEQEFGQNLMEYDWKRLGYDELDSLRMLVINQIPDRSARAHAEMFLNAERLTEAPFNKAETAYLQYLAEYPDYPDYNRFLTQLYNEISRVMPGNPAIPFELTDESGRVYTLEDFKSQYLLLDFWASWCAPCFREFPHMEELYVQFSRDDFKILGVSLDQDKAAWQMAVEQHQHPWTQIYAGEGFEQELFKSYRGGGIPFYILIDREGNIIRHNDIRPSFNLGSVLNELLKSESQTVSSRIPARP